MKLHHVGYLTKDLQAAEQEFLFLGFSVEQRVSYDPLREIDISFLKNGPYHVELIEPKGQNSPLFPLLKKYKNTPYHFCYITENLGQSIEHMEGKGYRVIQEPLKAPCIEGGTVAFLFHPDMGIVELLEQERWGP